MDIGLWYSGGSIHLIRLLNLCLAIFWSNNRASFWRNADSNFQKIVAPNSPYRNCYSNEKKEGCQLSRIRAKFDTKSKLSGATFLSDTQCTPTFSDTSPTLLWTNKRIDTPLELTLPHSGSSTLDCHENHDLGHDLGEEEREEEAP